MIPTLYLPLVITNYEDCCQNNIEIARNQTKGPRRPRVLSPLRGGGRGIEYLNDPDSYAGWMFHTPVRATQARQVEG